MENFIFNSLHSLHKDDFKKLKTGTILFGKLKESRWLSYINPALNEKEIEEFENEMNIHFPTAYKNLLTLTNGGYFYDLVRIAGKPKELIGMSREEQIHQPFALWDFQSVHKSRKINKSYFIFADSFSLGTIYVFDKEEDVLELDMITKKPLYNYGKYNQWVSAILEEGEKIYLQEKNK